MSSEGEVVYLIEDVIEFHPRDNSLISMETGERKTLLAAAASCLHLLLQHQGNLVTKKALFEAGWESDGLYVTDNTFYQNILILRRSFIALGFEKTLIVTITRKGLMIPADVNVQRLHNKLEEVKIDSSVAEVVQIDSSVKGEIATNDNPHIKGHFPTKPFLFFKRLAFFLVFVGISVAVIHNLFFSAAEKNYFAEYKLLGKIDGCIIFINNQQENATDYVRFTEKNPLTCGDKKYIYLTLFPFIRRVSVIRCAKPLLNQPTMQCVSDYYLEKDIVLQ
ncbi:winged helix-turn-helix domain-containing protein [Serratia fonticola]|uniref:winged helix-turn-helix domain-containing protein n=1 Tax=Serratia fonticola TaxID=47917 RepID=UPI003AAAF47A